MRSDTKKVLVTATVGVVGMLVLAFLCVKQCSDKKEARFERDVAEDKATVIEDRKERNDMLKDSLETSRGVVDSLSNVIAARDDEVLQLRDALELSKKNLENCEASKRVAKKKTTSKKVAKKEPAKTTCSTPVVSATVVQNAQECDQKQETTVCPEQVKATSPANANAVNATVGNCSNGNNININNGTINNYYGVVDTVRNAKKIVTYTVDKCYTGRVVRCK